MMRCKFLLPALFCLVSLCSYAQQAKIEVTNDPCGSCKASANGVLCGRCGSAMNIERENVITNPITNKTTYSYALKCSKDNHSVSCNSNVKIKSNQNASSGKVYCPICKKEFVEVINKQMIYRWETCKQCDGKGYGKDQKECYFCKEFKEIGQAGRKLEPKPNSVWKCYNCKPTRTFSLDLKELQVKKYKYYEYVDDVTKINE